MSCRDLAEWSNIGLLFLVTTHDDVIKWKHFPRYWPFVRGTHRPPVDSHHKGQGRGALMFSLICAWTNGWTNNRDAVDLRRHRAEYDVIIMHQGYFELLTSILMMTSSNGCIFRVTGPLCGNSPVSGEFPAQRPVTRSFDAFFHLRLNKRLSKLSSGWWFETPSLPWWRQCNVTCTYFVMRWK